MPKRFDVDLETGPVGEPVSSRDRMLGVGELPFGVLPPDDTKNVLGLTFQMFEIGKLRKPLRHRSSQLPGVR
jgi:hypothetical protein